MLMDPNLRLDILGAGPAGLGVGYFAKKNNIPLSIYESSNQVGGNCKTIVKGEFRYDTGAHRFHDKNNYITSEVKGMLGKELAKINVPSKIYHNGNMINFPLNLSSIIKNLPAKDLIKIGCENFLNIFALKEDPKNFKQLAYQNYGKTLSNLFLINYTEKLWGLNADVLDPSISGNRLKNLNLGSLLKQIVHSNFDSGHLDGSFYYPKHGFGKIFDKMSDYIGLENILFNSKITKLKHDGKKIKEIQYNDEKFFEPGMVINTLPINILANLFDPSPPENIKKIIEKINFRDVRLCVLFLQLPKFSDNASIYFPEPNVPFNRIYEPKNRSKKMAPEDKTCIVVETSQSRNALNLSDEEFFEKIELTLIKLGFLKKGDIFDYRIGLIPNAYPVLNKDIREKIITALNYFNSFENHLMHGRNAEFEYLHTHDLLLRSKGITEKIFR